MTAPNRFRGREVAQIVRMCDGKQRYSDEFAARAAGQFYRERFETKSLYIYKCPECAGYHLTRAEHKAPFSVDYDFRG
jgi:hypothetical protein